LEKSTREFTSSRNAYSESFDHYSRSDEETERIIAYVMNNPVKAGLVKSPEDWKWSYCKTGILPVKA